MRTLLKMLGPALYLLAGAAPALAEFTEPSDDCPGAQVRFEGTPDNAGAFIALEIPAGATVTCNALPDTRLINNGATPIEIFAVDIPEIAVALGGAGGTIDNSGVLTAVAGEEGAVAAGIEGSGATITNDNLLQATGTDAAAAYIEGDLGTITNTGTVRASGDEAVAMFIEGNGGEINNSGELRLEGGNLAAGMAIDGDSAELTNDGLVETTGTNTVGVGVLGNGATATNNDRITTNGENAFGMGVLGQGATLENSENAVVDTSGSGAHGVFLGLDNAESLSGGFFPPGGAVEPAQGTITNRGSITTAGDDADGIHVFAAGAGVENHNEITTTGDRAAAVSVRGSLIGVENFDELATEGASSAGIQASGQGLTITNGAETGAGLVAAISTMGDAAHGILVEPESGSITAPETASSADITNFTAIVTEGAAAHGVLAVVDDSTISNQGTISATGQDSRGISTRGDMVTVRNTGGIEAGSMESMTDPGAAEPDGSFGIDFTGRTAVVNSSGGNVVVYGDNSAGVRGRAGNSSTVGNEGRIGVIGDDARGVDVEGNAVRIENVRFSQVGQPFVDAVIAAEGDNAIGVRTRGQGAFVSNRVTSTEAGTETNGISVFGENAAGIDVTATGAGAYLVENVGRMRVEGDNAVGMALRNATAGALALSAQNARSGCLGTPKGAGLLNCGTMMVSGNNVTGTAIGILAEGVNDSTIDNFGEIVVTGNRATAIALADAESGAGADNNFILNVTDATATGFEAKGVSIQGDGNILVQGNDAVVLPVDAVTFTSISNFIDVTTSTLSDGTATEEQTFPLGDIRATGTGAVGVSVQGDNNVVGVTLGFSDADPPNIPSVIAEGAGSIGVELSGEGNTVSNFGIISGEGMAVQGGAGSDTVIGVGAFVGGIDLAGGADTFNLGGGMDDEVFEDLTRISGTIDGGTGIDTFRLIDSNFFGGGASSGVENLPPEFFEFGTVDGDRVTNFENFIVDVTDQTASLTNDLVIDTATIEEGTVRLDNGRIEAERITIREGGFLTGNGSISALPNDIGLVNLSQIVVEAGAGVGPGDSPGTLEFIGDTIFAGLLEIEIAGTQDGLFDRLLFDGDLTFVEGALVEFVFLESFLPEEGDIFDFLGVTGELAGLENLTFDILGLPSSFDFEITTTSVAGGFGIGLTTMAHATAVPEPATAGLLGLGLLGLIALRRRGTGDR